MVSVFIRLLTLICPSFLYKELPRHLEASTGSKQVRKMNAVYLELRLLIETRLTFLHILFGTFKPRL